MLRSRFRPLDPVEELRLRCWARRNYVPTREREPSWNPIVLEEMQARDEELSTTGDPMDVLAANLVPLEPEILQMLDPAQVVPPAPKLLRERIAVPADAEPYYF